MAVDVSAVPGWTASDTIGVALAILTFLGIAIALGLGVASLRTTKRLQRSQNRLRLLDAVEGWATDCSKLGFSNPDVPTYRASTSNLEDSKLYMATMAAAWWDKGGDCQNRAVYVAGVASSFGAPLGSAASDLRRDVKEYVAMLAKHRDDFSKPDSWLALASLNKEFGADVDKHHAALAESWSAVAKEVALLRVMEAR